MAIDKQVVRVTGMFTVGETGAVGTVYGLGVKSITRVSQGKYTIVFDPNFSRFLFANFLQVDNANPNVIVTSLFLDSTAVANFAYNTAGYTILTCDSTGAPIDPTSSSAIAFEFVFRRSTVGYK